MIDVHSHILPEMDDGSKSVRESLTMLGDTAREGIDRIVATSHFYPTENDPARFLERRAKAAEKLRENWRPYFPQLLLGAEVYYFEGMSRVPELSDLRIEGTDLLLLEMPFNAWTERMVSEILAVHNRQGIRVLLAHIERYMSFQKPDIWNTLLAEGIFMQCNASFFLNWRTRRRARRMLREGRIHLLGSDCHNMSTRPPRLGEALDTLKGPEREALEKNIARLFPPAKEEGMP